MGDGGGSFGGAFGAGGSFGGGGGSDMMDLSNIIIFNKFKVFLISY